MKKLYKKGLLFLGVLNCFSIQSCVAATNVESIENSIKLATTARKEHIEKNAYDINSPISEYSDRLINILNQLNDVWAKSNKSDARYSKYLLNMWNNNLESIPKESWNEVNHPVVKNEIAYLLGQSRKTCLIDVNLIKLKNHIYKDLKSTNKLIKLSAIKALGSVGDEKDILTLAEIALTEEEGFGENAIQSLDMLQTTSSLEKMRELEKVVKRKSLQKFINNKLLSYDANFQGFHFPSCSFN